MVEQQDSDCLPAYGRDQPALDGLLGDQAHRPPCVAIGRVAADHGDDPLLLGVVEHFGRTRAGLFIDGAVETPLLIAMADLADRLWSQGQNLGYAWRAGTSGQLQQRHRAQGHPDLLDATIQQVLQLPPVTWFDLNLQGWTCHAHIVPQNISIWYCFIRKSSGGQRPSQVSFGQLSPQVVRGNDAAAKDHHCF